MFRGVGQQRLSTIHDRSPRPTRSHADQGGGGPGHRAGDQRCTSPEALDHAFDW